MNKLTSTHIFSESLTQANKRKCEAEKKRELALIKKRKAKEEALRKLVRQTLKSFLKEYKKGKQNLCADARHCIFLGIYWNKWTFEERGEVIRYFKDHFSLTLFENSDLLRVAAKDFEKLMQSPNSIEIFQEYNL
jgi:hypothetical protein